MDTPILTKVEGQDYTFRDIFSIYDKQFQDLLNFILTQKGDIYTVEEFKDSTDKVLRLSESYQNGTVVVYINDIIQWKNEDYIESTDNTVTLINERLETDIIKVVIIQSNFLQNNLNSFLQVVKDKLAEMEEIKNKAEYLNNSFREFELRLEQKILEYNEEKDKVEELLATIRDVQNDIIEKCNKIEEVYNELDTIKSDIENIYEDIKNKHSDFTDKYEEIKALAVDISNIKDELTSINDDFLSKYKDFITKYNDFLTKYSDTSSMYSEILTIYEEIKKIKTSLDEINSSINTIYEDIKTKADEVQLNTDKSYTYYQDVVDLRNDIIDICDLTPEELVDNEVVLARSGAHILGDRLDQFAYYFEGIKKMQECLFLKAGDKCIVCDNDSNKTIYYYISDTQVNSDDIVTYNDKYAVVTNFISMSNFQWNVL